MNAGKALKYIFFIALGLGLLWFAFKDVEWVKIWAKMKETSVWGIAASALLGYLAVVSRGLRWNLMLAPMGHHPAPMRSVHAVAFSYMTNLLVPRSGEVARCAALNQTDDIPVDRLLGTVITERVVDFVMLFLFLAVALATNYDAFETLIDHYNMESVNPSPSPSPEPASGWSLGQIVLTVIAAALMLAILFRKKLARWFDIRAYIEKIPEFLKGIGTGIRSVSKLEKRGLFLFHTCFIWACYFFMSYVLFLAIPSVGDISMTDALLVMVAGGVGMVVPAPGGIGSYQYFVMLGFMAVGFMAEDGLAAANVVWLTQSVMLITVGTLSYRMLYAYRMKRA